MKKYTFSLIPIVLFLLSSCVNDDIVIETHDSVNDVNVVVSLSDFFAPYKFKDTHWNLSIADDYRTFSSESEYFIQVRTLIYNSNGELVDSLLSYTQNTNSVTSILHLSAGNYTAISTLTFANKSKVSWWNLKNKERLYNVTLQPRNSFSQWSIMSYEAKQFAVISGQKSSLNINPHPVGSLSYMALENFCYSRESDYGKRTSDNGIRSLCLYGRNIANEIRLDPNASDRYIYKNDAGASSWWLLSGRLEPTDFDDDWTYFETNLYDYFYILSPQVHVIFGYVLEGETEFHGYGEATYNIKSGETYLAYWDYFKIGNPYFGIADNNHWNTYGSSVKKQIPFKQTLNNNRHSREIIMK